MGVRQCAARAVFITIIPSIIFHYLRACAPIVTARTARNIAAVLIINEPTVNPVAASAVRVKYIAMPSADANPRLNITRTRNIFRSCLK
jgi:hypothetical protein